MLKAYCNELSFLLTILYFTLNNIWEGFILMKLRNRFFILQIFFESLFRGFNCGFVLNYIFK